MCRVVLVQTHYPGNLGAVARVMRNFGLDDLVLVQPRTSPLDYQARQLATHAGDILQQARIVPTLAEAIADRTLVVGTSARVGSLMRLQAVGTPEEIMPRVAQAVRPALVFGPEPTGLCNDDVAVCHFLLTIPLVDEGTSLNLAQAVAICLYELHRISKPQHPPVDPKFEPATAAQLDVLFDKLRIALEEIHFLYGEKADSLMFALRHLLTRSGLSVMETGILHGLARQIRWFVKHRSEPEA